MKVTPNLEVCRKRKGILKNINRFDVLRNLEEKEDRKWGK